MKTTINISGSLLREARKVAARERTTLRALVEEGLRQVLNNRKKRRQFRLRDASFGSGGLRPELQDSGWVEILDLTSDRSGLQR
jgi:hypothetical protein